MARNSKVQVGNKLLQRALKEFGDEILERVREIVQETGMIIYNNAIATVAVDSGDTRQSITFYSSLDGLTCTVEVGSSIAIYLEFGTGIYAEGGDGRKTPWVYWSDKLNRWVFTRGMPAQPFWFPSVDKGRRYFSREIKKLG
ncbi:HK97 gp10 family phage protein [Jeotgalibacillus soli]|uniref:HK97 gp10 family phage protein n=1 Tax=Jeotgalibacillus soli TaxID=889306 RepID=A0A0C2VMU2_9BACL|nr:HK97 gp10 family phage protein [Jeotgalibacillus soli]KIL45761.1 hypothetical protein KP78_21100 [Jeotgalibacillus soli]